MATLEDGGKGWKIMCGSQIALGLLRAFALAMTQFNIILKKEWTEYQK